MTAEVIPLREQPEPEPDRLEFECYCGCRLFYIVPNGMECSQCHVMAEGW